MTSTPSVARQSTCVAIAGRGLLIEGPSGAGKSSLALSLIDRGATLVGDDSISLDLSSGVLHAAPHERTRGLLEVRNLGLLQFPVTTVAIPVALILELDPEAPRFIESSETRVLLGANIPLIRLSPRTAPLEIKAELALDRFGLKHPAT